MDSNQELFLCQAVETGLSAVYDATPELTDALCVLGLDNGVIALKQHFGFARNETVLKRPGIDDVVKHVLALGIEQIGTMDGLTLKDYVAVVHKIRKSVIRHASSGPRAYYEFVRNYV